MTTPDLLTIVKAWLPVVSPAFAAVWALLVWRHKRAVEDEARQTDLAKREAELVYQRVKDLVDSLTEERNAANERLAGEMVKSAELSTRLMETERALSQRMVRVEALELEVIALKNRNAQLTQDLAQLRADFENRE